MKNKISLKQIIGAKYIFEYNPEDIMVSIWTVEDVQSRDKGLSKQDAREVLKLLDWNHDATLGINWDVIDETIRIYKEQSKND